MIRSQLKSWYAPFATGLFLSGFSFSKTSLIVGSLGAFFSTAPMAIPLAGLLGGIPALVSAFLASSLLRGFYSGYILHNMLAYHIPTLCASLYAIYLWRTKNGSNLTVRLIFALIPALCMVGFIVNEHGTAAWPYTLFWLIPIASALIPHGNQWLHALATTLTAHAVGSLLWIYTHTMPPAVWLGLIPVVCYERLAMGTFLWGCAALFQMAQEIIGQDKTQHSTSTLSATQE